MSQSTTQIVPQTTLHPSYTSGCVSRIQDILSDPFVLRIANAVSIPLSLLATYGLASYLILDPTTTIVSLGCAILVNTVALNYLHGTIEDWWSSYWALSYPVPVQTNPAAVIQTPAPRPASAPLSDPLMAATTAYQASLRELNSAIDRVKNVKARRISIDQGRENYLRELQAVELKEKKTLLECSAMKKSLILNLLQYDEIIESYGLDTSALKMAVSYDFVEKNSPQEIENAIRILKIDLAPISSLLSDQFHALKLNLSQTEGSLYFHAQSDVRSTEMQEKDIERLTIILKKDEESLEKLHPQLKQIHIDIDRGKAKNQEYSEQLGQKQAELSSIDLSLKSTQLDIEEIEKKLVEKIEEKKHLRALIYQLEVFGVPRENNMFSREIIDNNLYAYESESALIKLKSEIDTPDLIAQIDKALNQRQSQISKLKNAVDQLEETEVAPLRKKLAEANAALLEFKFRRGQLIKEIEKTQKSIFEVRSLIEKFTIKLADLEKKEAELRARIELAKKLISLIPIMSVVAQILKTENDLQSNFKTIVSRYQQAIEQRKCAEENIPVEWRDSQAELETALRLQAEKNRAERAAFHNLSLIQKQFFNQKINALKGAKYQNIVSKTEKVQYFYHQKIDDLTRTGSSLGANRHSTQNEIKNLNLKILEDEISIAAAKMEAHSFSRAREILKNDSVSLEVDQARLHLAEHRLQRHLIEEQWKISSREDAIQRGKELIIMIEQEQQLVFQYFALKLHQDKNINNQHAIKANFAILNLILDKISIEVSTLRPEDRKKFNVLHKIQDLFVELLKTEDAIKFNEQVYGQSEQPKIDSIGRNNWFSVNKNRPITINPFIEKLTGALKLDEQRMSNRDNASAFTDFKFTNFLEELNSLSRQLHKERGGELSVRTSPTAFIESKIDSIQIALQKPFLKGERFKDRDTQSYESARYNYQREKYLAKTTYASKVGMHIRNKASYQAAEARQRGLDSAEQAARHAAQNAVIADTARVNARNDAQAERDAALRNRVQAIETYGWVEKLSYLIPSAALWALYQFSPLLSYIDLSLRISQNILLISSATHLFVQSFFRNPLSNAGPSASLPDRMTTT